MSDQGRPPAEKRAARSRLPLGIVGAAVIAAGAGGAWLLLRPSGEPPDVLIRSALERLDRKNDSDALATAKRLAEEVQDSGFRDPGFPGAAEFVRGMVASRAAADAPNRKRQLASAVKWLRDADGLGLDQEEDRRAEWAYALGTSLFALGRGDEARPLLEEVWWTYEPGRVAAGLALAEIELASEHAEGAIGVAQIVPELLAKTGLSPADRRRLTMIRARAALREGRPADAEAALAGLSPADASATDAVLLKAEARLAAGRYDDAHRLLAPLARARSRDATPAQQASAAFLLGRCDEKRGDPAAAAVAFEEAAGLAPDTPDGIAAAFAAGRLLQAAERDEEAIALFHRAIDAQAAREPAATVQARDAIRAGCSAWVSRGKFAQAAELAAAAEPVLGRIESVRLQARCREQAARELEQVRPSEREPRREVTEAERRAAWRQSGDAFRDLAAAAVNSSDVSEALWTATDHFRRAHAFEPAEAAYSDILELGLPASEAAALAGRGRTRLDLARPADAAKDFQAILDRHPTDPEAFEARLLLGRCHQELGEGDKAEAAWRGLLALAELSPDAAEWRAALFALAELLYRRGAAAAAGAEREAAPDSPALRKAVLALDESIARFGEYVRRAPNDPRAAEAHVFRADALRRRAEVALRRAADAETATLAAADRREAEQLFTEAAADLRAAQDRLAPEAERLPPLGRDLLKTTYFDLGHTYASLGRDREAVVTFGAAVNRYPEDGRVLAAHLRMAECHRRLGRPDEARSAVEAARLLLQEIPAASFDRGATALSKDEWAAWLTRARDLGAAAP